MVFKLLKFFFFARAFLKFNYLNHHDRMLKYSDCQYLFIITLESVCEEIMKLFSRSGIHFWLDRYGNTELAMKD